MGIEYNFVVDVDSRIFFKRLAALPLKYARILQNSSHRSSSLKNNLENEFFMIFILISFSISNIQCSVFIINIEKLM